LPLLKLNRRTLLRRKIEIKGVKFKKSKNKRCINKSAECY